MEILKIILLIIAYSLGIATLIVQIVCYLKDLEYKETIFLTISFLLVIIAATIHNFIHFESVAFLKTQSIITSILIVLLAISIPINIHKERIDKFRLLRNKFVIAIGILILIITSSLNLLYSQKVSIIIVGLFLILSIIYSMIFIFFTKPQILIQKREKTERIIAAIVLFVLAVTILFFLTYPIKDILTIAEQKGTYSLALICIILSLSKLPDDIKKLSRHEVQVEIHENKLQQFSISQREHEVILLLIKGKAYKEIASDLFISLSTVKSHVSNIYKKMDVRNRLELSNMIKQDLSKIE